jgi:transposase
MPSARAAKTELVATKGEIVAGDDLADRLTSAGLTVRDVALRYRVSEDKVRAWIARGELAAINTAMALCGRPRWVIPPEALVQFERRRAGGPTPKPARRQRRVAEVDYYPD